MSTISSPTAAATPLGGWIGRVRDSLDEIDSIDLLLGFLLLFGGVTVGADQKPISVFLAALIVAVASFRRPKVSVRWGGVLLLATLATFGYLVALSAHEGVPWTQRAVRFVAICAMAAAIAQRRVDPRSIILGLCVGATVNVPLYYLGLTQDDYPPYLTGFFGDKNVAGMYYAVLALLGLAVFRAGRGAFIWATWSLVCVFLTGSRTATSGLLLALAWFLLRNKVSPVVRWALCAIGFGVLQYVETNFAESAVYSDRTGTDWFRHQIDLATEAKLSVTPWTGSGLNQGFVFLDGGRRAWFHDSYAQAFVEGGWIFLAATVFAFAVVGMGLLSQRQAVSRELLAAEASMVVLLVCAWKLGEVFMTVPAFLALGAAISFRLGVPLTRTSRWWTS